MVRVLFLAAGFGLLAAAAAAASPVVPAFHAGDVVTIHWGPTSAGVEEMELLLSLDGGRHFNIRVTPDLDADRGSYAWTVPPFPARNARLAVRVNLGGREVLGAAGQPFAIEVGHAAAPWSLRERGGDLWVTAPEDRNEAGMALGAISNEPAGWQPLADSPAASLLPPVIRLPASRSAAAAPLAPAAAVAALHRACEQLVRDLRVLPLRI